LALALLQVQIWVVVVVLLLLVLLLVLLLLLLKALLTVHLLVPCSRNARCSANTLLLRPVY
jgi:hypothetical protein